MTRHGTTSAYRRGCRCAECRAAVATCNAAYRASHREEIRARNHRYRAARPGADNARSAAYHAAHREENNNRRAERYAVRRDEERATQAAWRAAHLEQVRAYSAAYRAEHRQEARDRSALWREAHPHYMAGYDAAHPGHRAEYGRAHPEARGATSQRRRARMAGVESERFTLAQVIERDGWKCGVCGKKVAPKAKGRDRKSLDHIVPISLGGPHTLANAQLAHVGCNSAKGRWDRVPAQMRLFG